MHRTRPRYFLLHVVIVCKATMDLFCSANMQTVGVCALINDMYVVPLPFPSTQPSAPKREDKSDGGQR